MNFLDLIWLIPVFPLLGAVLMLLLGKTFDPQPPSEVATAPGVEHIHDEHDHGHSHDHHHGLVLAFRLREGLPRHRQPADNPQRQAEDATRFFHDNLVAHFRAEEEVLFPVIRFPLTSKLFAPLL